jgi:hypothetical protein
MSEDRKYDNIPDRRPHVYTVGMDGTDVPLPTTFQYDPHPIFGPVVVDHPPQSHGYCTRITELTVHPLDDCLQSELATRISIQEEEGGWYLQIEQPTIAGGVRFDWDEWQAVRAAADWLAATMRAEEK